MATTETTITQIVKVGSPLCTQLTCYKGSISDLQ